LILAITPTANHRRVDVAAVDTAVIAVMRLVMSRRQSPPSTSTSARLEFSHVRIESGLLDLNTQGRGSKQMYIKVHQDRWLMIGAFSGQRLKTNLER
jgi:hypothetical protein